MCAAGVQLTIRRRMSRLTTGLPPPDSRKPPAGQVQRNLAGQLPSTHEVCTDQAGKAISSCRLCRDCQSSVFGGKSMANHKFTTGQYLQNLAPTIHETSRRTEIPKQRYILTTLSLTSREIWTARTTKFVFVAVLLTTCSRDPPRVFVPDARADGDDIIRITMQYSVP